MSIVFADNQPVLLIGSIGGTWTGTTIGIASGGTGQVTAAAAINALLPSQTAQSGNFLTTNGTVASWAATATLPSQIGQSGNFLTTNGTVSSWSLVGLASGGTGQVTAAAAINALLPSQTAQSGNFLTTNGTVASWAAASGGGGTGANPSATIGLTAVNGSASTFLRSDGAPALGQTIVPTWTGLHTFAPTATASGATNTLIITQGANTNQTASTEAVAINFNLSSTVQFATGALTTQRAFIVQAPTYGFVGASTLTNATTFDISGAPIQGTNATITNKYAFTVGGPATPIFSINSSGTVVHNAQTTSVNAITSNSLVATATSQANQVWQLNGSTNATMTAGGWLAAKRLYFNSEYDNGNSGSSITIDWTNGNKQKVTLTAASVTITFSNGQPVGTQLKIIQDGTGGRQINWTSSGYFASSGTAPSLTSTAAAVDILGVYFDGSSYFVALSAVNLTAM